MDLTAALTPVDAPNAREPGEYVGMCVTAGGKQLGSISRAWVHDGWVMVEVTTKEFPAFGTDKYSVDDS